MNQNSKVAAGQINNELKLTIKLRKAERSYRVSDNSLWVHHYINIKLEGLLGALSLTSYYKILIY